ncbi:MAG: pyridine nucleotide-disulfide oxidoreductase [Firmicutes bacterium HGW-Firmicutes-7]|nr:MAG: pyridine nucleotide-disulfide oxidoreductase [Firmicutes bacterium HGW-Firmicutes-7]
MEFNYDVVVVGGGPAGLGAAAKAKESGLKVAILERNFELGGILNQCIHSGFGLGYFGEDLTGPEYSERFIDLINEQDIEILLNTMVIEITSDREITAVNKNGLLKIKAGAIILAMGCRERTRGAIKIPGSRPSGVFTAGQAQRYMNLENLKPGKKVVILGSGDIGLIMARRMTLEGIKVLGVYELMPYANGLQRNIKQCLDDFKIPLHLSTTVIDIIGKNRLEAVIVAQVDEKGNPIEGTEEKIECDTLLLSTGLIPENELSVKTGIILNKLTNGPLVNANLETNIRGIFACGNALHVHDLVDYVTKEAELAGQKAADFVRGKTSLSENIEVTPGENVRYTVPNYIPTHIDGAIKLYFRVTKPIESGRIVVKANGKTIFTGKEDAFKPSEMMIFYLTPKVVAENLSDLTVAIKEEK